jgi:hypothetical protein
MRTNRAALAALVAGTTLATASVTTAEAAPCPFFSTFSTAYNYFASTASKPRKALTARKYDRPTSAKTQRSYASAAAKPDKIAGPAKVAAKRTKNTSAAESRPAAVAGPALSSVSAPASKKAKPAASVPAEPEVSACLTKEYLETGAVMFKDTCTQEWAINSTDVSKRGAPGTSRTCLSKDVHGNGVVVFKDNCTKEWGMNTGGQSAESQ